MLFGMEILDNRLGWCLITFIVLVGLVWYIKPGFLFNNDGSVKKISENENGLSLSFFGICSVLGAIVVYYLYALFRYS